MPFSSRYVFVRDVRFWNQIRPAGNGRGTEEMQKLMDAVKMVSKASYKFKYQSNALQVACACTCIFVSLRMSLRVRVCVCVYVYVYVCVCLLYVLRVCK